MTLWFQLPRTGSITMRFKSDADEVRWKLDCQELISLLQRNNNPRAV